MGGQNSVKKFLVFPIGVEPVLESLHKWGVDNLWRQRVPAVHDSDSEGEHFCTQAGTSELLELLQLCPLMRERRGGSVIAG